MFFALAAQYRVPFQVLKAGHFSGGSPELRAGPKGGRIKGRCNLCHAADRASDEKPQKRTSRKMILTVRQIDRHFPDGKEHVNRYTCRRRSGSLYLRDRVKRPGATSKGRSRSEQRSRQPV